MIKRISYITLHSVIAITVTFNTRQLHYKYMSIGLTPDELFIYVFLFIQNFMFLFIGLIFKEENFIELTIFMDKASFFII